MVATSPITPLHAPELRQALDAVAAWEDVLNTELIGRQEEVHLFALALAARESLFLLGVPGVAKSMTVDRGVAYIGGVRYFKVQLGELSTPEEALGPWSMKGLMNDRFERVTRWQDDNGDWHESHWSQNCHVVLWDEAYKTSEAMTNVPLMMMNERQVIDNGVVTQVPLCTFVVNSNEERKSDGQMAFDDRLLLRRIVPRTTDKAERKALLQLPEPNPNPVPVITWDQWETVQRAVAHMPVADDVYDMIIRIEDELLAKGVEITPRRLRKCIKIVQAEALLEGAAQAGTEHVAVFEHCAWLKSKDQQTAQQVVLEHAAPQRQKGLKLLNAIEECGRAVATLIGEAEKNNTKADVSTASELQAQLAELTRKLDRYEAEAGSSKHAREIAARCVERKDEIAMELLTKGLNISAANVQAMFANRPRNGR